MARPGDLDKFSAKTYRETVKKMADEGEKAGDRGQEVFKRTGKLDPLVNVFEVERKSCNAFSKNGDNTYTLVNGIKIPIISMVDGTGSMGENVEKGFLSMERLFDMLSPIQTRYQIDLSTAVVQDTVDFHPVFQMSQFESDNRAAEHVRLLVPDGKGGDAPEDYDLGLWYVENCVETDFVRYEGLKGYFFLIGDQIGRGRVCKDDVKTHLGHSMQEDSVSTSEICDSLLKKWNFFYIEVEGSTSAHSWWSKRIGSERVIEIDNPDLLAEVQASLVYVTEYSQPTEEGLGEFLKAKGNNKNVSQTDISTVWEWLQVAESLFGAQAKAEGYNNIPMPGDIFKDIRDIWPIGHEGGTTTPENPTPPPDAEKINWTKF